MEKKICKHCDTEKDITEFNKKGVGRHQRECRECQRKIAKEYYAANNEKQKKQINEARRIRINENRIKYFNYLKTHPCIVCGNDNPIVLEFDHRDDVDKIATVGELVSDGFSWEKIKNEIDKCDVRCSNCHRIRTAEQFGWYKDLL
jgi:hypothetical protein